MIDGLRGDWGEQPIRWMRGPRSVAGAWFWLMALSLLVLLAVSVTVFSTMARADTVALSNCSQSVGAAAAAVAFPASGSTGPSLPSRYLQICDAHATNTLGVNFSGGTASIGATGTVTLNPGGCLWWNTEAIPSALSIIGSGASTTTACGYK